MYVNPALQGVALLPNGEPKGGSPVASTLIYGREDAVLADPGFLADEAQQLGDWVASKGRNLTDIFITHGHGDPGSPPACWPTASERASSRPLDRSNR